MSVIAAAVKHMLAAGMPHEAIVSAVAEMENEAPTVPVRTARQERNRRYYEKRKASEKHLKSSDSDEQDANKTTSADGSSRARACSNISLPSGDIKNLPSEGKKTTGVVHALPLNEAFDAWDQTAKRSGLPTIRERTSPRIRQLQARLKAHGLNGWLEAMAIVERSAFLTGQNGRGWRANFDFVVKAENFAKIVEGAYAKPEDRPAKPVARPAAPRRPETEAEWAELLQRIRPRREWHEAYGPPPYEPDTLVPQHLITFKDTDWWRIRRAS